MKRLINIYEITKVNGSGSTPLGPSLSVCMADKFMVVDWCWYDRTMRQSVAGGCFTSCGWLEAWSKWDSTRENAADWSRREVAAARQIHVAWLTLMMMVLVVGWVDLGFEMNLVGTLVNWFCSWCVMCACVIVMRACVILWCLNGCILRVACSRVCVFFFFWIQGWVGSAWARSWPEIWSGLKILARTWPKTWIFGSKSEKLG